jgi:S-DNA-T family DNA segregation ATPase FtsK/SpoIIIE
MFGRTKKTEIKSRNTSKTAFAPRRSPMRPLWALGCFAAAVLTVLAFLSYNPLQPVLLAQWLGNSAGPAPVAPPANWVGLLGSTFAALTCWLTGYAGLFFLPIYLFCLGYWLGFRRAHIVRPWRLLLMVLTLIALAGLATWLGELTHLNKNSDYFPHGDGGYVGYILYDKLMMVALGKGGSAVVLGLVYVAGLVFIFIEEPGQALEGLWHAFAQWRLKKAEAKRLKREEEQKAKAAALLESKQAGPAAIPQAASAATRRPGKGAPESEEPRGHGTFKLGDSDATMREAPSEYTPPEPTAKVTPPPARPAPKPVAPEEPARIKARSEEKASSLGSLKIIAEEKVEKGSISLPQKKGDYVFPGLDLLAPGEARQTDSAEFHQERAGQIVRTLADFGVQVRAEEIHTGPVITRYEVSPAAGVRVEKIVNLDKNLALALKADGVRIIAPVPGKGTVGIEVPNRQPASVRLREIIESKAWAESPAEIPVVLGKDVTGKPMVTDLTKMPHALIAGATGSGKTVCINAIIASLVFKMGPEDLRFIMVDPKIVEMQIFNDLPHMLVPVVTEPKKVPAALKYLISEMERRYQLFARVGARNIAGFNAKMLKDKDQLEKAEEMEAEMSPEERAATRNIEVTRDAGVLEHDGKKLPYIVCIIDELADLMMVAPADIETYVARLAQLARAAGIHLILATQRPSVNVITGVIKANLPCRIAFKVASKVDSRTILDTGGADTLIGRGDMLFVPPGSANLVRAQGAFVSDDEINAIVDFLKRNGPPEFSDEVQAQIEAGDEDEDEELEEPEGDGADEVLVREALEVLRATKRASTSMLQRRLKIGYNRAARIMELLEAKGIVGPENGSSPREILKDLESL